MTLREKIETMEAFERGEEIESKAKVDITWDLVDLPMWDWANKEYRIKPKEPVYEYIWVTEERYGLYILNRYLTEEEIGVMYGDRKQRIDFTKRERKL